MVIGVTTMDKRDPLIKPGRPRIEADYSLVLHLRDEEHLGWTRGALEYRKRTGLWISRDTFKRRYLEAKATPRTWAEELAEELTEVFKEHFQIK